jgi:hypothetical protein
MSSAAIRWLDGRSTQERRVARKLIEDTCSKQQNPSWITDHSCRSRLIDDLEAGCLLMTDLGVTKTHSRIHSQVFFSWYNDEHRHSGIGMLTPAMVHYGHAEQIFQKRQFVLDAAYHAHLEHFVHSAPKPLAIPKEVWINKPIESLIKSA